MKSWIRQAPGGTIFKESYSVGRVCKPMNRTNFRVGLRRTTYSIVVRALMIRKVEDFSHGYPQLSRLYVAHPSFAICRRFLTIRARLLLMKQDELSILEEQLDAIDRNEPRKLFLGNARRDRNKSRKKTLRMMDTLLKDYGE